jgi:hypothetical protein
MKRTIISLGAASVLALSASGQGIVAGWDFADVLALDTTVDGYAAEKRTSNNNGFSTSGSISTNGLVQNSEVTFAANGAAAGQPGFNDGFSQFTTDGFGGAETGQQSLNVYAPGGAFDLTFSFTESTDVVFNFDWLTSTTGFTVDILDVSYSSDGSIFTPFAHPTNGDSAYWAGGSTAGWAQSTGNLGGLAPAFGAGQTDMSVDLTGLGPIQAVRLEFSGLGVGERVGIDNVHIAGTAIPEPSSFAALAGLLALGFVALRRRNK